MPKKKQTAPKPRPEKPKVEVVNRPLFHEGTKQLERRFFQAKNDQDLDALHALRHELSFRDSPQSVALSEQVEKEIGRYEVVVVPAPPESPLADVIRWLEQVAARITHDEALALRERLTNRFPDFARFLAEREPKPDPPRPLTPQPRQPGLPFDK